MLVAVRARPASIPARRKIRSGALHERWPATFPEGQGSDFAGVVDAVGPGVTDFAPGDEVLGFTNNRASHAEFVVAESGEIVPKPPALGWPEAGALFVVGTSAYALVHAVDLADGRHRGRVGRRRRRRFPGRAVGSQSRRDGRRAGRPAQHDWLRGYGVVPVDYAGPDLAGRIRAAVDGRQVERAPRHARPEYVQLGLELGVRPDRIASIADFAAGERGAHAIQHTSVARPEVLTEIAQLLASGRLELPIAATYPLAEVGAAYRELESGHTRGKIVLVP